MDTQVRIDLWGRGDWNYEHVWNSNGFGLFCFPRVCGFLMVDKMAAILFGFPRGFHGKTELLASPDRYIKIKIVFI